MGNLYTPVLLKNLYPVLAKDTTVAMQVCINGEVSDLSVLLEEHQITKEQYESLFVVEISAEMCDDEAVLHIKCADHIGYMITPN